MELLRQALGERQISYAGFSYGTMLGVLYADRYPDRVRAFVLDGMLDPTASAEERNRAQALGFERALDEFLDECAGRSACKLRGAGGARKVFDTLMAAIDRKPLAVGTRSVGPAESITAVVAALYNRETGWARLETALEQARKGDGKGLLAIADEYVDRSSTGRYADTNDANLAINCVDAPSPRDAPSYDAMAARLATKAPLFGPVTAYFGLPCAYWSVVSPPTRALPRAEGSAPILVIGTTGDPATPLAWAKRVASSLDNGRLLVFEGEGHTAYIGGPRCITRAVEDYLVTLRVPRSGTKCRR
jgi:pimeloyl-ACP methyl ester carboxylesterase